MIWSFEADLPDTGNLSAPSPSPLTFSVMYQVGRRTLGEILEQGLDPLYDDVG